MVTAIGIMMGAVVQRWGGASSGGLQRGVSGHSGPSLKPSEWLEHSSLLPATKETLGNGLFGVGGWQLIESLPPWTLTFKDNRIAHTLRESCTPHTSHGWSLVPLQSRQGETEPWAATQLSSLLSQCRNLGRNPSSSQGKQEPGLAKPDGFFLPTFCPPWLLPSGASRLFG